MVIRQILYNFFISPSNITLNQILRNLANIFPKFIKYLLEWPKSLTQIILLCKDLSSDPESILVIENLSPKGYTMGPPLFLDEEHLLRMTKPLAEFHSLSYVLRVTKDPKLEQFKKDIIYLPWHEEVSFRQIFWVYCILGMVLKRFLIIQYSIFWSKGYSIIKRF